MKNQIKRVIVALFIASCCVLFHFILNTLMTEVITGIIIGYFLIEIVFLVYVWFEQTEIVFEDKIVVEDSCNIRRVQLQDKYINKEYYNKGYCNELYYIKDYVVYNLNEEHLNNLSTGRVINKKEAQYYIDTSSINKTNDLICGSLNDTIVNNVDKTLDTML